MAANSLSYRTAREYVRNYEREFEDVMLPQREEAIDCRDCEAFLQLGIDAFEWICRADLALRAAAATGADEYTQRLDESLKEFCKRWLAPREHAEAWIKRQLDRGFEVGNLAKFRQCCEEMRAIVKFNSDHADKQIPDALIPLRDQALKDFDNGQTAEFV
jgi:hypothetical protein